MHLFANNIATVRSYLSCISGSCSHSFGITIVYNARIMATVNPSSFYSSGLWLPISGIYPNIAISNIVGFVSYYSDGIGNYLFLKYYIIFYLLIDILII